MTPKKRNRSKKSRRSKKRRDSGTDDSKIELKQELLISRLKKIIKNVNEIEKKIKKYEKKSPKKKQKELERNILINKHLKSPGKSKIKFDVSMLTPNYNILYNEEELLEENQQQYNLSSKPYDELGEYAGQYAGGNNDFQVSPSKLLQYEDSPSVKVEKINKGLTEGAELLIAVDKYELNSQPEIIKNETPIKNVAQKLSFTLTPATQNTEFGARALSRLSQLQTIQEGNEFIQETSKPSTSNTEAVANLLLDFNKSPPPSPEK